MINNIEAIKKRLEYLRQQIRNENISYGEIAELQSLAKHIDNNDIELLQWAGVKENEESIYDNIKDPNEVINKCIECGCDMPDNETGYCYECCEKLELNTCDKCKTRVNTHDLVWITAEDFEPKKGEKLPKEIYKKYDALCESCYQEELI